MLTKSERRFVEDPDQYSKRQRRLYRCRINKKIRKFSQDFKIIVERNEKLQLDLKPFVQSHSMEAFQNSETLHEIKQGSLTKKNSFLDDLENW